jgi:hypothetical protein
MKRLFLFLIIASFFSCNNNPEVPGEHVPDTTQQPAPAARMDTVLLDSTIIVPNH